MTARSQATNLATGTTVFALPAGLRWESRHDLSGYIEGRKFSDVCIKSPIKALANWRHVHEFFDHESGTLITDSVHTRIPHNAIIPLLAYRQQQLIHDISSAQRFACLGNNAAPLTIALSGSRGTIGSALRAFLSVLGHKVIVLVRKPGTKKLKSYQRHWNPINPDPDLLNDIDVLVHLAGEPIRGRFTQAHMSALRESRITPTFKLAELVATSTRCSTMVTASAMGFYGCDKQAELLSEESPQGEGFLAELCADWEHACQPAISAGKRVVTVRTGVVLSSSGGILPVLKTLFSTGLGGKLTHGDSWLPWISIDDLTDIYVRAIVDKRLSGSINACAPNPIHNSTLTNELALQLDRPALFPIPDFGPKLLFGTQGATEFALASHRAIPKKLTTLGHTFRYPQINEALAHELGNEKLFDTTV
nr:TIGR01777 family oxidoreductase [Corynebacterium kutscheri]